MLTDKVPQQERVCIHLLLLIVVSSHCHPVIIAVVFTIFVGALWLCALHPHRHPPVAWSDPPLIRVVINPAATYCGRLLFFLIVTLLLVPPPIVQICRQPRDPPLVIYHSRRKAATTLTRMKTTKELKVAHLGGGPMPPD